MNLSKRISVIEKFLTKKDILYFRDALKKFKNLISKIKDANPEASILDCVEKYNEDVEDLILSTHQVRYGELFKYITVESLLSSRDKNKILKKNNSKINISEFGQTVKFNGNLEHDYFSLIQFYFQGEVLRYELLSEKLKENPNNSRIRKEMNILSEKFENFKSKKMSIYEMTKLESKQIETFECWKKKFKSKLQEQLTSSIIKKLVFLKKIGCLSDYEDSYNKTVDIECLPSCFRITNKNKFDGDLIDYNKLRNYSVADLVAINAFWTNKLVKEVEKWNEVIYVIINSNKFNYFKDGEYFELEDEDIIYYLSEYRGLIPYITKYKHSAQRLESSENKKNEEIVVAKYELKDIFSKDDIAYYGYSELDAMLQSAIFLNDCSQLLYDQKDIAIEEMIGFIINTKEYENAGISLDNDDNKFSNKPKIVVDLKGFNAPITLHIDLESIKRRVKLISGSTIMPMYRGGKDLITNSAQNGKNIVKTNMLFKLNSEQRKAIIARSGIIGARDTNGAYITHIAWMINPKKEMPKLINESKKLINLENKEIMELNEDNTKIK